MRDKKSRPQPLWHEEEEEEGGEYHKNHERQDQYIKLAPTSIPKITDTTEKSKKNSMLYGLSESLYLCSRFNIRTISGFL